MGDRGNIIVNEEDGGVVYLYTHWTGYDLPRILARALDKGRSRWDDESYLTRTIFSEMIKDDVDGITGYGISTHPSDSGTDIYVDMREQKVRYNGDVKSFDEWIKEQR